MNAQALRRVLNRMYSQLNYYGFCEYMEFNYRYDEKYWNEFVKLVNCVATFDDTRLQKMLDFSSINEPVTT